jgi:hypothetical protein
MSTAAAAMARSAAPSPANWMRRAFRALLTALDRLLPPRACRRDGELPAAWFKHPPI